MVGVDDKTIEAAADAADKISRPHIFATIVALASLAGIGLLVWSDARRVDAQLATMGRFSSSVDAVTKEVAEHRTDDRERWNHIPLCTPIARPDAPAVWHR